MAYDYSDDDFDSLPINTLNELENTAIQFTQQQQVVHELSSDYGDDFDGEGIDDSVTLEDAKSIPVTVPQPQKSTIRHAAPRERFGLEHYESNQAGLEAPQRSITSPANARTNDHSDWQQYSHSQQAIKQKHMGEREQEPSDGLAVSDLQKQIDDLIREQERLRQEVNSKTGEIAIVRSKQEQKSKEYERQLDALKKVNADEVAQQKKAAEAARNAERNAATELEFAKRDLAEESEKYRALRRVKEKAQKQGEEQVTTPKKNKNLPYRDGFDDDEIQVISPSKWQGRKSNPGTPSKGANKRKRKGVESPIAALDVLQEAEPAVDNGKLLEVKVDDGMLERLRKEDKRLDVSPKQTSSKMY
jgi:hypothetical protein